MAGVHATQSGCLVDTDRDAFYTGRYDADVVRSMTVDALQHHVGVRAEGNTIRVAACRGPTCSWTRGAQYGPRIVAVVARAPLGHEPTRRTRAPGG